MNKIHLLLLISLTILLSWILTGCSLLPNTSLEILNYSLEKTVAKDVWTAQITGVAHNNGSARLEYAEIEGNFYSQEGTLLATGFAKTIYEEGEQKGEFFTLDPGQTWEFTISYQAEREVHPSLTILNYRLEKNSSEAKIVGQAENDGDVMLSFAQITGEFYKQAHPSLAILSCSLKKDSSGAKAVGQVQNDGDVALSSAQIEVTFYDAADKKLAEGAISILDIDVGQTVEYEVFYPGSNYNDIDYAIAKVTNPEYDEEEIKLASSTASTTDLEVGETWNFSILYPTENYEQIDYITAEVTTIDYPGDTYYQPAEQVDYVTVEVGSLRGSTVMP